MNAHTFNQKLASLKRMVINHPEFERAYEVIEQMYQIKRETGMPQNVICVGQSGTGKSTLKERISQSYARRSLAEKVVIPVLVVDTPSVPTVKNLAEEMLIQLGDPRFNKGSAIEKTNRILHYLKHCEVNMVIFDELQHFIDQGRKRAPYEVAEWLKTVIDKAQVSTVLMGLERSEEILNINEQLRRRFSRRVDILPFDVRKKPSREAFIGVANTLAQEIGLNSPLDLTDRDMVKRLYFATNG